MRLIQVGLNGDRVEELLPGTTPHGVQGGCVTRSSATGLGITIQLSKLLGIVFIKDSGHVFAVQCVHIRLLFFLLLLDIAWRLLWVEEQRQTEYQTMLSGSFIYWGSLGDTFLYTLLKHLLKRTGSTGFLITNTGKVRSVMCID